MGNSGKSFARFYLDKPLPRSRSEGMPKHYNAGYSGSFESEFDYSERTQQKRLDKRSEEYEEWLKEGEKATERQIKEGERDVLGAVASSWLTSLGYNMQAGEAVATFKGTSGEFYYKMSYEMFLSWYNSPSKGRWLHDHPTIMHSYTMRSGRGSESMQDRLDQFHTENNLKERGDKKRMKSKVKQFMEKWG